MDILTGNLYKSISELLFRVFGNNNSFKKIIFRPQRVELVGIKYKSKKPTDEKFNHIPMSKPVVEKQTLLKEKKKVKTVH